MPAIKFEALVRPFETRDISPPKVMPVASTVLDSSGATSTVTIIIGKKPGNIDIVQTHYSASVTTYMTKRQREATTALGIPIGGPSFGGPP